MTVYFIGAGPGAVDLLTVRGLRLLQRCPVCLYAGSLVTEDIIALAPKNAKMINTASLTLDEIITLLVTTQDQDVARLHSGDPSLFSAITEQIHHLERLKIPYEIVPGVPAYAAAAAALKSALTVPEISQTIILTRIQGNATSLPYHQTLKTYAQTRATLAIHLSIRFLKQIVTTLTPFYGENCPVYVVYRVSCPDQHIILGTLADIVEKVRPYKITRTALIFVGWVFQPHFAPNSALYNPKHPHIFRPKTKLSKNET